MQLYLIQDCATTHVIDAIELVQGYKISSCLSTAAKKHGLDPKYVSYLTRFGSNSSFEVVEDSSVEIEDGNYGIWFLVYVLDFISINCGTKQIEWCFRNKLSSCINYLEDEEYNLNMEEMFDHSQTLIDCMDDSEFNAVDRHQILLHLLFDQILPRIVISQQELNLLAHALATQEDCIKTLNKQLETLNYTSTACKSTLSNLKQKLLADLIKYPQLRSMYPVATAAMTRRIELEITKLRKTTLSTEIQSKLEELTSALKHLQKKSKKSVSKSWKRKHIELIEEKGPVLDIYVATEDDLEKAREMEVATLKAKVKATQVKEELRNVQHRLKSEPETYGYDLPSSYSSDSITHSHLSLYDAVLGIIQDITQEVGQKHMAECNSMIEQCKLTEMAWAENPDLIPSTDKLCFDKIDEDFVVLAEPDVFTLLQDKISTQCAFTVGRLLKVLPRIQSTPSATKRLILTYETIIYRRITDYILPLFEIRYKGVLDKLTKDIKLMSWQDLDVEEDWLIKLLSTDLPVDTDSALPSHSTSSHSNSAASPSNNTSSHSNSTTSPSNSTSSHSNSTTSPSNNTSSHSNSTTSPSNNTSSLRNSTASPSNDISSHSNGAVAPSNNTSSLGNPTTSSSIDTSSPHNNTGSLSNDTSSSLMDSAGAPDIHNTPPGNHLTMPSSDASSPSYHDTLPSNSTTSSFTNSPPLNTDSLPGNINPTKGADQSVAAPLPIASSASSDCLLTDGEPLLASSMVSRVGPRCRSVSRCQSDSGYHEMCPSSSECTLMQEAIADESHTAPGTVCYYKESTIIGDSGGFQNVHLSETDVRTSTESKQPDRDSTKVTSSNQTRQRHLSEPSAVYHADIMCVQQSTAGIQSHASESTPQRLPVAQGDSSTVNSLSVSSHSSGNNSSFHTANSGDSFHSTVSSLPAMQVNDNNHKSADLGKSPDLPLIPADKQPDDRGDNSISTRQTSVAGSPTQETVVAADVSAELDVLLEEAMATLDQGEDEKSEATKDVQPLQFDVPVRLSRTRSVESRAEGNPPSRKVSALKGRSKSVGAKSRVKWNKASATSDKERMASPVSPSSASPSPRRVSAKQKTQRDVRSVLSKRRSRRYQSKRSSSATKTSTILGSSSLFTAVFKDSINCLTDMHLCHSPLEKAQMLAKCLRCMSATITEVKVGPNSPTCADDLITVAIVLLLNIPTKHFRSIYIQLKFISVYMDEFMDAGIHNFALVQFIGAMHFIQDQILTKKYRVSQTNYETSC